MDYKEKAIRSIVASAVQMYAAVFSDRHISEKDNEEGVINMKIHNVFIAELGPEIQYYSALARSLDSSLGNMLERMAIQIARLHYIVSQHVEGKLYKAQTDYIAELLEEYKNHARNPFIKDYKGISAKTGDVITKRHESNYYLVDEETGMHYLIELKIGGDLDNKKARSEKEALLEQYCILTNELGNEDKVKIMFSRAYDYNNEEKHAKEDVLQYFSKEELCIGAEWWNFVSKSPNGFDIINDEIRKNAYYIQYAFKRLRRIKRKTCKI